MNAYTLLSGENITYPAPSPAVADYLQRVLAAANDPAITTDGMIALVYSPENPLLDGTIIPGRGVVTAKAFHDPVFRIMADQIGVKRVRLGTLDIAAANAAHTVSVKDAAAQLGITANAVRTAIATRKLGAVIRNGQWYMRPEAVASYKVSGRGRKKATPAPPPVEVKAGNAAGVSLSVKIEGGELEREGKSGNAVIGRFQAGWTRATVRTTTKGGQVRTFVIEPDPTGNDEIEHGGLFVRGAFRVTKKINNPKAANAAWESAAV